MSLVSSTPPRRAASPRSASVMTPTGSSREPRATKKRAWPLARASCQSFSMGSSKSSQMTSGRGTMMDSTLESATAKTPSTKRCSAAWNTP